MTARLKVAFLLNHLNAGGAERVAVTFANALAKLDCDVTIVLTRKMGSYLKDVDPSVRVEALGRSRMLFSLGSLVSLIRRERFDCVVSHLDQPNVALLIARHFFSKSTKCIITEHSHPQHSERGVNSPVWWLIRRLRPLLYKTSDHIVAVNETIRGILISEFGVAREQVSVVPNPVDVDLVVARSMEDMNHPWLVDRDPPVVLSVGRLVAAKNYNLLLDSIAIANRERPCRLIILGEGEERAALEQRRDELGLQDIVDMPGFSGNPYSFMSKTDCFVLSSQWEGSPVVLIEALACGATIVATDCPSGPRELLEGGKFGTLVPVHNAQALARGIIDALKSPLSSDAGRARAAQFSPGQIGRRYLEFLRTVCTGA